MSASRIHTFTGTGFDPLDPRTEDVRLEDIAHALANTCRFGGHTPRHYSVAQHAVLVACAVLEASRRPDWALLALHHDSAEAYLGDIPRPIKRAIRFALNDRDHMLGARATFEEVEGKVQGAILAGLGLLDDVNAHGIIRDADNAMLVAELRGLFGEKPDAHTGKSSMSLPPLSPILCQGWEDAKRSFIAYHEFLLRELGIIERK